MEEDDTVFSFSKGECRNGNCPKLTCGLGVFKPYLPHPNSVVNETRRAPRSRPQSKDSAASVPVNFTGCNSVVGGIVQRSKR